MEIERLTVIPVRDVWAHEAHDFTRWLGENLAFLGEKIDLGLSLIEREQAIGDFSADLVAEDDSGRTVVIENQFGRSDHDHLGKMLTYLSALNADVAVWVVEEARPEHAKAVEWMNSSSEADLYLVQLEVVQVGDASVAPLFTPIVRPSQELKRAGREKRAMTDSHERRQAFLQALLERAESRTSLHQGVKPTSRGGGYPSAPAGFPGMKYYYNVRRPNASLGLGVQWGTKALEGNRQVVQRLKNRQDEIHAALGPEFTWDKENANGTGLFVMLYEGGYDDAEERWPQIHDVMIDTMIRLVEAIRPLLEEATSTA